MRLASTPSPAPGSMSKPPEMKIFTVDTRITLRSAIMVRPIGLNHPASAMYITLSILSSLTRTLAIRTRRTSMDPDRPSPHVMNRLYLLLHLFPRDHLQEYQMMPPSSTNYPYRRLHRVLTHIPASSPSFTPCPSPAMSIRLPAPMKQPTTIRGIVYRLQNALGIKSSLMS